MMAAEEGERIRLSKSAVVDRALKLADSDGLDTLTIRKLAQDLGVTPMALYWHFRSKDELMEALAERVWSEVEVTLDDSASWSSQLRSGLESLLAMLRAHSSGPRLVLEHEKRNEAALRATNTALEILHRAGFRPEEAVEVARSTLFTAIMLVTSEPGNVPGLSPAETAERIRRDRIELSLLDPARFPRVVECAIPMTSCDDLEFHYEFGVSLFMAGVEAMAARAAPERGAQS
jgi:AcrR family transcriptional regulator